METYSSTEVIGLPADAAGGLDARAGAGPTSPGTLGAVIGGIALIVVGTALGLGLGVGLHSDDKSLIYITTIASDSTTTTSTSASSTNTTTTTSSSGTTSTSSSSSSSGSSSTLLSHFASSLTSSSPVYGGINQTATNFSYEAIQVVPSVNGTYTFTTTSGSSLKLLGYLYNNSFLVTNPSANLVARDDSTTGSLQFNLTSTLTAGTEYILVVSTANSTGGGPFNVTASGPGNVTFTARSAFSQIVMYGTLSNNNTNDFSNGSVTVNLNDTISGVDGTSITGYVNQISINFAVAPLPNTGVVYVHVLNRTENVLIFTPSSSYQIPASSLANSTGVQTFTIPRNQLPVVNGQYVGLGLGTGGGSAFMVPGFFQAFLITSNVASLTAATYTLENVGNAFAYRVFTAGRVVG